MKFMVTGGAGFIGCNIVRALNERGHGDIVVVDNLERPGKFANLVGLRISDYLDKGDFLDRFAAGEFGAIEAVFHEGACSDTMEHNGRYVMDNNFRYSKRLLDVCLAAGTRLLYASSAAVYGNSTDFRVDPRNERPLNVYGYSKLLFDDVVRRHLDDSGAPQIAGFRYFNVYGPGEVHKGRMASVAFHHMQQLRDEGHVRLFGAYDNYDAGQQSRDFVYVGDVVRVNLWFLDHPEARGVYNLGAGRAEPFNAIAHGVINGWRERQGDGPLTLEQQVDAGLLRYIDFPDALKGKYQSFTQADISGLRQAGYDREFLTVAEGIGAYVQALAA
jgi:ADP-L-glycero-D-manno-heptose 6-epimerase